MAESFPSFPMDEEESEIGDSAAFDYPFDYPDEEESEIGDGASVDGNLLGDTSGSRMLNVPTSVTGSDIADGDNTWYINAGNFGSNDVSLYSCSKETGRLKRINGFDYAEDMVYLDNKLFGLVPAGNGMALCMYNGRNASELTEGHISDLSSYDGQLYYIMNDRLYSIPGYSGEATPVPISDSIGEYVIINNVVYYTNMDKARNYSVRDSNGRTMTTSAGQLYYYNLQTGVRAMILNHGVQHLRAFNGELYL